MTSRTTDIPTILREGRRLDSAAARAVQEAIERLRRNGVPIASSCNGRISIEQTQIVSAPTTQGK